MKKGVMQVFSTKKHIHNNRLSDEEIQKDLEEWAIAVDGMNGFELVARNVAVYSESMVEESEWEPYLKPDTLKIKCTGQHKPKRGNDYAAGIDLYNNGESVTVTPEQPQIIETKTAVEIPDGYVGLVVVRSGLGFKGLNLINSVGVIDSDYRGDIKVKFVSTESITLEHGTRVAQLVIVPYLTIEIELVDELSETSRGSNGFGSTGSE